jgi:hypothetical protein
MLDSRHLLITLGGALFVLACGREREQPKPPPAQAALEPTQATPPTKLASASVEQRLPRVPRDLAWLAFGGGSDPLSNQVSMAQDLELAGSVLAGRGFTMFASGPGAPLAIERSDVPLDDPHEDVTLALARLFGPAGAEHVRYQASTLPVDAPATRDHVVEALSSALEGGGSTPLVILAASHGERGATARENELSLWGGWSLSVEDVAELLDHAYTPRPTRWVVTACYGGGFAELAFVEGKPQRGLRSADHCGLFAAPWDDQSSGCDPNPDRRQQDAYAIHFFSALRGEARDGRDHLAEIDVDKDARVGLLEAHAWARIHSHSFDVPTTTAERFLREFARSYEGERSTTPSEPEELAVVRALSSELELDGEREARAKLAELDRILADVRAQLDEAQRLSDDSYFALRVAVLERWPLIEHAWEPRTRVLLEREGARIQQMLTDSELARGYATAERELADAAGQHDAVRVTRARVLRLVRAHETLRLASVLKRRNGARYEHYQALRRCERYVPDVRAPMHRGDARRAARISPAVEPKAHAK